MTEANKIAVIARENERSLVVALNDDDLNDLIVNTRRQLLMSLEDGMTDWVRVILETRRDLCEAEIAWRKRAEKKGGPAYNPKALTDRLNRAKIDVSIAELISRSGVVLKRSGHNTYRGLCPFHDEKTPSLHCWQNSNRWKCFGCDLGGTTLDYVMQWRGVDVKTALSILEGVAA